MDSREPVFDGEQCKMLFHNLTNRLQVTLGFLEIGHAISAMEPLRKSIALTREISFELRKLPRAEATNERSSSGWADPAA